MIHFFRQIRQRLLTDLDKANMGNKISKYLLYAIGEIVLVVIGILIALQINNLNERNKTYVFEKELLHSFKNSLQLDLSDIDLNIGFHTNSIRAMDSLIFYLESNKNIHQDSIALLFSQMMLPTYFQYSTSAFETLKSRGITTIENENLRDKIIGVYDSQYNFFLQNQRVHAGEIERGVRDIFPSRFVDSYSYDLNSPVFKGSIKPLSFKALKSDQEFKYYLKTLRNRTVIFIDYNYANLRQRVAELLEDIELEIEKKETE